MPVKLYEEKNCVWNHRKELAQLGTRALIVTGKHSAKKNGSLADVQKALEAELRAYLLFDEVEENPSVETIMKAREMGLAGGVDFVIGIGGGSPMDAAKAIALMLRHKEADASYLYEKGAASDTLPLAEVPTTCGTGSEVTAVAILTRKNEESKTKGSIPHKMFADLALCDPTYLKFAPASVLGNTAIDAFAHMAESIINANATDYSRLLALSGLRIWGRSKEVLLGNRAAEEADYENLMNASSLGGMSIAHTGTSLPHGLSYTLTVGMNMPHGKAVGYFLPGYLKESDQTLCVELLGAAGFADAEELESFYAKICGQPEVPGELLEQAVSTLLSNEAKLKNCPYRVDEAVLRRIAGI